MVKPRAVLRFTRSRAGVACAGFVFVRPRTSEPRFHTFRLSLALLEIIQDINQLPEAPVLTAVEAKRNSGKINRILILTLFR